MEIKHWFWLADSKKPPKMVGNMLESEFDRHVETLKRLKENDHG